MASTAPHKQSEITINVPSPGHGAKGQGGAQGPRSKGGLLKVSGDFYILASAMASRRTTRVLAEGESFAVFEATGDILESPLEALGFFHRDTRHLSRFELSVAGSVPHLLNSYISDDNAELRSNLTNPDLRDEGGAIVLPRDLIQIQRSWVLEGGCLFQRIAIRNYAPSNVNVGLEVGLGADFADMFEVRGIPRTKRGEIETPVVAKNRVEFRYTGADAINRSTVVVFDRKPAELSESGASFTLNLKRDESVEMTVRVEARQDPEARNGKPAPPQKFSDALSRRRGEVAGVVKGFTRITTNSDAANSLLTRSLGDLASLTTVSDTGHYVMSGIPWFATLFGRDSLITGLSVLPFCPSIAAGILRMLASLQGEEHNYERDEQPGKIMHEMRRCESANTGEVPFGRYYGSIDSTPLFLWLIARYVRATGDLKLAADLWPNVERALAWIEQYGDRDGDGYIEYQRETPRGLANQGWKDSLDGISHADGRLADPPIALAEVQGYAYAAYRGIGDVSARLGHHDLRDTLHKRAAALKANFERDFWIDDRKLVALALDGGKKPCCVMASNGAHCLATGILDGDRAAEFADRLLDADMFSGWGIRTLGTSERRYNPMSYHNGSVWPHDNAIAAMGLSAIGRSDYAAEITSRLFEAALGLATRSLPELFCGFEREPNLGPAPYPVACQPQAWSAASVFLMMQAVLGMEVMGFDRRLLMRAPTLPPGMDWLKVEHLRLGDSTVSFVAHRGPRGAAIEILEKTGKAAVEVHK